MPYEMQLANLFMINCNFLQNMMCYCMYIYIFSVQELAVMETFSLNIATPTDVLHITGLESGKMSSGMKLTIIIWMIFYIHTFVLSHLKKISCIMLIYI